MCDVGCCDVVCDGFWCCIVNCVVGGECGYWSCVDDYCVWIGVWCGWCVELVYWGGWVRW